MLITGLSGQEERKNLSLCLGMSHPLLFVYSLEKCPPLCLWVAAGEWPEIITALFFFFYYYSKIKLPIACRQILSGCPRPAPVLLGLQTGCESDGNRSRTPMLQADPPGDPSGRGHGGSYKGTVRQSSDCRRKMPIDRVSWQRIAENKCTV